MPPGELSSRAATSGTPASAEERTLRDDVVQLARTLPGDLRRLCVRSGESVIEVEWAPEDRAGASSTARAAVGVAPAADPPAETDLPADVTAVPAPLVGTFYVAASPDADPFVQVGDTVEPGQTLGIVEAMKLMNPIVAEEAGVITEILVGDAESVEYGQVLMYLRTAGGPR
ncbi:MAG TPA: acetyl-CoA carboxylase biotin carboxyl carrier protein subunit [Blastococcus sp.]|nr:acetyl-CoA carboxylase biotin carboxyl carrier protein subunit [Blastococcus sp.]